MIVALRLVVVLAVVLQQKVCLLSQRIRAWKA
jgi:hypothetical protein